MNVQLWAAFALTVISVEAHAQSCAKKKGPLDALPKLCDGAPILLDNPLDCGSCVVTLQASAALPEINELETFFENPQVQVGGVVGTSDLKIVRPTCIGETGEILSYAVYVRRREVCNSNIKALKDQHVAPAQLPEILKQNKSQFLKAADDLAKKDQDLLGGLPKDEIMDVWKTRMQQFKSDQHCLKGVELSMSSLNSYLPGREMTYNSDQDFRISDDDLLRAGNNADAVAKNFGRDGSPQRKGFDEKTEKMAKDYGLLCHGTQSKSHSLVATVDVIDVPVSVAGYFENSLSSLSDKANKKLRDEIKRQIQAKAQEKPGCIGALRSIEVEASANKLANGGNYSRWDFESLSKDRADFLMNNVLPKVDHPGFSSYDYSKIKPILGDGGKGSSGDCPYRLVPTGRDFGAFQEMRIEVLPKYRVKDSKAEKNLEEAKRVRAVLRFSNECKSNYVRNVGVSITRQNCMQPTLRCR